jgi:23S rRNA (adenine2503-C2)-methyltransferase
VIDAPAASAVNANVSRAVNLLDLAPDEALDELARFIAGEGEASYRAAQIFARLWQRPVASFEDMSEVPKALRQKLAEHYVIPRLELQARQTSSDGTEKFLFRLADGQSIETVAIPEGNRLTLCISSQAGCALQCAFCATGAMGFQRNLTPSEIAGQVRELRLLDSPLLATNIVFMGMGEPLMNWNAVDRTLTRWVCYRESKRWLRARNSSDSRSQFTRRVMSCVVP